MTSFCRVFSLPYALHAFRGISASIANLGAKNNCIKLIFTQSRCLSIKKAVINQKTEPKNNKQHKLFQLNYVDKKKKERVEILSQTYSDFSDLGKRIQDEQLDFKIIRNLLFGMLHLHKQHQFSPDFSTEMNSFIKSEEFEKFAQSLEKSLPMASPKTLYLIFQVMHIYRIPYLSILMQKLHALILDNINNFQATDIFKMYLLIEKSNDKILEPVKNAFLVYMNYLTYDNLEVSGDLKSFTYFVSREGIPLTVKEAIVKRLLSLESQLKDVDPQLLVWLSYPLCSEHFQHWNKRHFFHALEKTINNFQPKHLEIILQNLENGVLKKFISYDSTLFDQIAESAVKCSLQGVSSIMARLIRIGHVHSGIANVLAEKFIEFKIESLTRAKMDEIICNLASINYKDYLLKNNPEKWCELERVLLNYIESELEFRNMRTLLSLYVLGFNPKESANKVLTSLIKFLKSSPENTVSKLTIKRAFLLQQYFFIVNSKPPEDVPENFFLDILNEMKSSPLIDWEEIMYKVFLGKDYVLKNCRTPFKTIVSYVVIVGPDNNLINLSSYKKTKTEGSDSRDDVIDIEKIERPPGSKVLAFIECGRESIRFRNRPLMRLEPRALTLIHKDKGYKIIYLFMNQNQSSFENGVLILTKVVEREIISFKSENKEPDVESTTVV